MLIDQDLLPVGKQPGLKQVVRVRDDKWLVEGVQCTGYIAQHRRGRIEQPEQAAVQADDQLAQNVLGDGHTREAGQPVQRHGLTADHQFFEHGFHAPGLIARLSQRGFGFLVDITLPHRRRDRFQHFALATHGQSRLAADQSQLKRILPCLPVPPGSGIFAGKPRFHVSFQPFGIWIPGNLRQVHQGRLDGCCMGGAAGRAEFGLSQLSGLPQGKIAFQHLIDTP